MTLDGLLLLLHHKVSGNFCIIEAFMIPRHVRDQAAA